MKRPDPNELQHELYEMAVVLICVLVILISIVSLGTRVLP